MVYTEQRKTIALFSFTMEKVTIWARLRYNMITDSIKVSDGFHKNGFQQISWKPTNKRVKTNLFKVPKGYIRHHIAYHFNDPDKGVVVISRSLHAKIHNPLHPECKLCME